MGPTKNRTISVLHDDDQNLGTIEVINECSGLEVTADLMLRQVFQNLIDNSLKHGEKVRHISLHCTKDKDGVKLFYKDDGVGVPKTNNQSYSMQAFLLVKATGLGLYLIKKLMDVYGWTITEEGEPGKGAKFVITIPNVNQVIKENC